MTEQLYEIVSIIMACLALWVLFHKKIRTSDTWKATVTPLASIIGSGFLVSAPLLLDTAGGYAVLVMTAIVVIAYGVGMSIRFNIKHVEPILNNNENHHWIYRIETISRPILGVAYLISVTFYLKLLSAFALHGLDNRSLYLENALTSIILFVIGFVGLIKGLSMLEILETYSVNTKLAIILALSTAFLLYNLDLFSKGEWHISVHANESIWQGFREILGMLIIVQGFETSRFIGEAYEPEMRIRTMKYAQLLSGIIYVVFVALSSVIINDSETITETTIIDLSHTVADILPYLLIIAAALSQFSAAVSDTLGGGGLLSEASNYKLNSKTCYAIMAVFGVFLTWSTNIYQIISIASKAFASYYGIQVFLSLIIVINNSCYAPSLAAA